MTTALAPALARYQNGGYQVSLHADGTKVRTQVTDWPAEFPESVDLKVTDYCDAGCAYCHERSTVAGRHGDLDLALDLWAGLPAGVELAIGGGNPLAHPGLEAFLRACQARGHVCNLTVNQVHLAPFRALLGRLLGDGLVHGLGLSVRDPGALDQGLADWLGPNLVYHLILGVHTLDDLAGLPGQDGTKKVLLLGYKTFGRGVAYRRRWASPAAGGGVDKGLDRWRRDVPRLLSLPGTVLSFDNLALEQLDLRRWFSADRWNNFFMGHDGEFTMYVDVVRREYAIGSTSVQRHPIPAQACVADLFQALRADAARGR